MSEELKQRIRIAIADKETAEELIAMLETQAAAIADLTARVEALENP